MVKETSPKAGSTGLAPGQAPWRHPKAAGPAGILAYDAQRASSSQGAPLDGAPALVDGEVTMVQELQKAVDSARKMESKVKRIHLEQAERKAQWQNWEQDLKRTYVKERARFQAALNRLDGELQEALRAQEQARSALRQVANGQQAMEDVGAAEGAAEFEELIGQILGRISQEMLYSSEPLQLLRRHRCSRYRRQVVWLR